MLYPGDTEWELGVKTLSILGCIVTLVVFQEPWEAPPAGAILFVVGALIFGSIFGWIVGFVLIIAIKIAGRSSTAVGDFLWRRR